MFSAFNYNTELKDTAKNVMKVLRTREYDATVMCVGVSVCACLSVCLRVCVCMGERWWFSLVRGFVSAQVHLS